MKCSILTVCIVNAAKDGEGSLPPPLPNLIPFHLKTGGLYTEKFQGIKEGMSKPNVEVAISRVNGCCSNPKSACQHQVKFV